ncbi:hypothetical protein PRUPE_1G541900 [Prunus persica]|uniref:Uncharacterized protein n=1 Tax=Prunus persica TaxID=3760 RepID=M5XRM1_PRUPE|nr:hypothetical protein PRUPE_1G541900 [Prunus persica]
MHVLKMKFHNDLKDLLLFFLIKKKTEYDFPACNPIWGLLIPTTKSKKYIYIYTYTTHYKDNCLPLSA